MREEVEKPRGYHKNHIAWVGLSIYSLVHIIWIVLAFNSLGFGIFRTATLIGGIFPVFGIISLVGFQCFTDENKFSLLVNLVVLLVIGAWFLCVWSIIAAASAAV